MAGSAGLVGVDWSSAQSEDWLAAGMAGEAIEGTVWGRWRHRRGTKDSLVVR